MLWAVGIQGFSYVYMDCVMKLEVQSLKYTHEVLRFLSILWRSPCVLYIDAGSFISFSDTWRYHEIFQSHSNKWIGKIMGSHLRKRVDGRNSSVMEYWNNVLHYVWHEGTTNVWELLRCRILIRCCSPRFIIECESYWRFINMEWHDTYPLMPM